jgi:hypothetical protein
MKARILPRAQQSDCCAPSPHGVFSQPTQTIVCWCSRHRSGAVSLMETGRCMSGQVAQNTKPPVSRTSLKGVDLPPPSETTHTTPNPSNSRCPESGSMVRCYMPWCARHAMCMYVRMPCTRECMPCTTECMPCTQESMRVLHCLAWQSGPTVCR